MNNTPRIGFICNIPVYASMHGCLYSTSACGGVPKATKVGPCATGLWKHEPQTNIHFSPAGISMLYCPQCVQNADEGSDCFVFFAALRAECGRTIYNSQSSKEWSSHFTITGEIIIPWPQTQRQPYQQDLGFSKHVCEGTFSQHFSNVTYLISISDLGSASAGKVELRNTLDKSLDSFDLLVFTQCGHALLMFIWK